MENIRVIPVELHRVRESLCSSEPTHTQTIHMRTIKIEATWDIKAFRRDHRHLLEAINHLMSTTSQKIPSWRKRNQATRTYQLRNPPTPTCQLWVECIFTLGTILMNFYCSVRLEVGLTAVRMAARMSFAAWTTPPIPTAVRTELLVNTAVKMVILTCFQAFI